MTSQIKTFLLLALLSGVILFLGGAAGGQGGLMIALIIALVMNVGSYWFSDTIVLRMYRAKELDRHTAPEVYTITEELAEKAGLPMPKLYLIPQQSPNAFATGRNPQHAVVAVTEGIVRLLSRDELRGVIAHELGHVKNRDILIQSVAAVLATTITFMANMMRFSAFTGGGRGGNRGSPIGAIAMALLAPFAAMLIQMAISRAREYKADATAVQLSGQPRALAQALNKLQPASQRIPLEANPATASMFIINPLSGGAIAGLFSTHPPAEERINRLLAMEQRM